MIPSTGIAVIDAFLSLLDAWGYLVVFGFTVFENLFVVGSLTPGETVVIAGAAVSANGLLVLWGVWVSSLVGTVVGSNASYLLGRRAGLEKVKAFAERAAASKVGRLFHVDPGAIDEVRSHFHTRGAKTIFIARFAVGAKNFVPAMAGATHMPLFWFELYTLLGAMVYTSLMCAIGWFLGENLDRALKVASGVGYVGLAVLLGFFVFLWWGGRRLRARRAEKRSGQ